MIGFLSVADEFLDRLAGGARRDFAGRVAAHAIGHEKQAEVLARGVRIFVAFPLEARVCLDRRGKFQHLNHPRGRA